MSDDVGRLQLPAGSGISTFLSSNTLESRKRKRDIDTQAIQYGSFDAKIVSTTPTVNVSFSHVTTILRAHLPLSWLRIKSISSVLPPSTILEAIIPSVGRWEYHILIARHLPNGALYAIEKVEESIFVCHPLQSWVSSEWVEQAAIGAAPHVSLDLLIQPLVSQSHVRQTSNSSASSFQQLPTAPSSPKQPKNRRGILARKSILEKEIKLEMKNVEERPQTGLDLESDPKMFMDEPQVTDAGLTKQHPFHKLSQNDTWAIEVTTTNTPTAGADDGLMSHPYTSEMPAAQTEVDHLSPEYLRKRYLETLYLAKTSLAFYAKGPLSRARARMRVPGSLTSAEELASYYRDSILPAKKMDLKYKESIKNRIMAFPQQNFNDLTEEVTCDNLAQKPKKSRKVKLGKDAIWPMEVDLIEQWWKKREHNKTSSASADGQAAELHNTLAQLRMRETELQIILILEVMTLEAVDNAATRTCTNQVGATIGAGIPLESVEPCKAVIESKPVKVKKRRDLNVDLESLLDRLCIWHTVGLNEHESLIEKSVEPSRGSSATMKDRLRDFCKDVIVPFYGGKVPEQCKIVCRKLGGPEISPQRPRSMIAVCPPPGAVIATRKPSASKRTLERVLSEDQGTRNSSPPILMRSSTLPLAPALRRESSQRPASSSIRHKSISFSNREIDLVADANITAAKRQKLETIAAQKRELDAAIEALKKPNRTMVAKDFMDDLEGRTVDRKASFKRVEPVQINATPRHRRIRPDEDDEHDLPALPLIMPRHIEPVVPSSTVKQRGTGLLPSVPYYSAKKKAVLSAISYTPPRSHLHHSNSAGFENQDCVTMRNTGGQSSSTLVNSTPSIDRRRTDMDGTKSPAPLATYKPCKLGDSVRTRSSEPQAMIAFKDIPQIPQAAGRAMDRVMMRGTSNGDERSIYDSLGWNDDFDR